MRVTIPSFSFLLVLGENRTTKGSSILISSASEISVNSERE